MIPTETFATGFGKTVGNSTNYENMARVLHEMNLDPTDLDALKGLKSRYGPEYLAETLKQANDGDANAIAILKRAGVNIDDEPGAPKAPEPEWDFDARLDAFAKEFANGQRIRDGDDELPAGEIGMRYVKGNGPLGFLKSAVARELKELRSQIGKGGGMTKERAESLFTEMNGRMRFVETADATREALAQKYPDWNADQINSELGHIIDLSNKAHKTLAQFAPKYLETVSQRYVQSEKDVPPEVEARMRAKWLADLQNNRGSNPPPGTPQGSGASGGSASWKGNDWDGLSAKEKYERQKAMFPDASLV